MVARDPYRIFFPLGLLLAWAGVGHWFLHSVGVLEDFRPIFHAMTQIQGFLTAFAVGFLFTMIPRRTESAPPAPWQLAFGMIAPVAITISVWFEQFALSQVFWIALMLMMLGFVVKRFREEAAKRRPPNSFVWIPVALVLGLAGSVLTGVGASLGTQYWWLHDLGRRMILQGVFVSMILGVGGLAIPLMTRGDKPSDASSSSRDRIARALHLLAALALTASFFVEQFVSLAGAMFLRAAVVLSVLISSAEVLKPPAGPGANRRLIWLAAWMLPLGYFVAGLFDEHAKAGLHVVFIGGFALLTLTVSAQVSLGHGGRGHLLASKPLRLISVAGFLFAALGARVMMEADPDRYFHWMGCAAALFLAATIAWAALVAPALRPAREVTSAPSVRGGAGASRGA
jgi:uncharacterized protein involved in response to NO